LNEDEFPYLWTLLAGYFHEDWDLDASDWQGVVEHYRSHALQNEVTGLRYDVARILDAFRAEMQLERIVLRDMGCQYDPRPGYSVRSWLKAIVQQISDE
jgi:hypothetical protein